MPQDQPRRAKQSTQRAILPQPASPPSTDASEFDPSSVQAPARRGRKPGPLSRAARETQRKLNHSIIEKARRTKINDALTSLKQLVPAGYGQPSPRPADEDEEGKKKKGKKEDKEKEFKLEILERTVVFLQDLLKRVEVLEANVPSSSLGDSSLCAGCSSLLSPHSSSHPNPIAHPRHADSEPKRKRSLSSLSIEPSLKHPRLPASPRLPSISSWLPNLDSVPAPISVPVRHIDIDPQLLNTSAHSNSATGQATGLPSPPASTHFTPQHPFLSSSVPTLHLGASVNSMQSPSHSPNLSRRSGSGKLPYSPPSESCRTPLLSPLRTLEDESAASLLLQISARGSVPSSTIIGVDRQAMSKVCQVPRVEKRNGTGTGNVQAQTPGSILGLDGIEMSRG